MGQGAGSIVVPLRARHSIVLRSCFEHFDDLGEGAWFNLRASNTEPLLRLNVEARDGDRMESLRDEVQASMKFS